MYKKVAANSLENPRGNFWYFESSVKNEIKSDRRTRKLKQTYLQKSFF